MNNRRREVCVLGGQDPRQPGGVESVVSNIAAYAPDRYEFVQYCAGDENRTEASDIGLVSMYSDRVAGAIECKHAYSLKAARNARRRNPALVHGHGDNCLGSAIYRPAAPYVVTFHGTTAGLYNGLYPEMKPIRQLISVGRSIPEYLAAQQCDVAIACSEKVKREVVRYYDADPADIVVIENGVDTERFVPVAREEAKRTLGLDGTEQYVTWVGTGAYRKGLETAIRAVELVDADLSLLVAGTEGKNTDSVTYLGRVADRKMNHVYSAGEAFVFPSLYEGHPLSVLEALSCATPVITSPFMPVIEGEVRKVSNHEPIAYADALADRLSTDTDREAIRQQALHYDWQYTVEQYISVYDRLVL